MKVDVLDILDMHWLLFVTVFLVLVIVFECLSLNRMAQLRNRIETEESTTRDFDPIYFDPFNPNFFVRRIDGLGYRINCGHITSRITIAILLSFVVICVCHFLDLSY